VRLAAVVPVYRHRPSALHAARASIATLFCAAPAATALIFDNPVILLAGLAGVLGAGLAAGVGAELRAAARLTVPLTLLLALVNPLVSREGGTVLARGPELLGRRIDVTLEATVYGGVAGLRVLVLFMAVALFSSVVDPDELLRMLRRVSYRSALTAALATRLVPVLARDAMRMGDAARCRAEPPGRAAVARAALGGALDRAADLSASLEVRGYGTAKRPARVRRAWSRHDASVAAGAGAVFAATLGAKLAGVGRFEPYPELALALGPAEAALAAALVCSALAPFAGSAARLGVARA